MPLVPEGATVSVGAILFEMKIIHLFPLYLEGAGKKSLYKALGLLFLLLHFNNFSDSGLSCLSAFLVLLKSIVFSFLQKT